MRISNDKVNHISKLIINDLEKRDEFDYKTDLNDVRLRIAKVMKSFLQIEDQADEGARKICASYSRKLREGTDEWDMCFHGEYLLNINHSGRHPLCSICRVEVVESSSMRLHITFYRCADRYQIIPCRGFPLTAS